MNAAAQRRSIRRSHARTMGKLRSRRTSFGAWAHFLTILGIVFVLGSMILIGAAALVELQRAAFAMGAF